MSPPHGTHTVGLPDMFPVGFAFVGTALFLLDCAVQNRNPVEVLHAIIADPAHMRDVLSNSKGTGFAPATVPTNAAVVPSSTPAGAGAAAAAWAQTQVGKPYKWGATGPDAYDCSGLVQAAFAHAGVKLPRTSQQMLLSGSSVPQQLLQVGDLVFPDAGHVQIYVGNGNIVEAPRAGATVRVVPMWGFLTARRVS